MRLSARISVIAVIILAAAAIILRQYRTAGPETNADYAHPERAAEALFGAFARENWTAAAEFWPAALPAIDDRVKGALGGLQVVRLDKPCKKQPPFKVGISQGPWQPGDGDPWIPYEIRTRNGAVRKADLRLSWNGSQWQLAGGL